MTISVSLPIELIQALQKLSRDTDISLSRLVKNLLSKALPGATVSVQQEPPAPVPEPIPEPGYDHDRRSCE